MKKTIIRIVAVAMLALMVLTALPAFAYNIVGTAAAQTPVYKDTKGRKVELYVSGPVTINRQDNKSGMYNVTVSYDGKTYTGWVYPSAISGIGYDKSTGGSASGSTSGTTSGTSASMRKALELSIMTAPCLVIVSANSREVPAPAEVRAKSTPLKSSLCCNSLTVISFPRNL